MHVLTILVYYKVLDFLMNDSMVGPYLSQKAAGPVTTVN